VNDAWIGLVGVAIGAVIGFAGNWLTERSGRRHADAHRFEAEKQAVYVRIIAEAARLERQIRDQELDRAVQRQIHRRFPDQKLPRDTSDRADYSAYEMASAEVALLGRIQVEMSARLLVYALQNMEYASGQAYVADLRERGESANEPNPTAPTWDAASTEFFSARTAFIKAAKRDLDVPTGVMSKWQERRWRRRKRIGLASRPKEPASTAGAPTNPATPQSLHRSQGGSGSDPRERQGS